MTQVLFRCWYLLRRPGALLAVLAVGGGGVALVFVPLLGLPGYELSEALALGVGLLGGLTGMSAAFAERNLVQAVDPRPPRALRADSALVSTWRAITAAAMVNALALAPPLVAALVFAAAKTPCDPFAGIGFFPLLALPSAVLAAAAGALCAFAARGPVGAAVRYGLLVAASLAVTAWPLLAGPQVYAYNHFLGHLPGPVYDEVLSWGPPLLWFRAQTLLLSALAWLLCAFFLDMKEGRFTRPHFRPGSIALLLLVAGAAFLLEEQGPQLGFRMSDAALRERLGGRRESEHFVLFHPRTADRLEIDRWVRDLEFRHAQLTRFFGQAPSEKLSVYLYRSAADKRRWVGAASTQFAKPWRYELHVNQAGFPHPALKHELAHLMAAPFGSGPFRICARLGVWPNMGVVEGLATAADDPVGELTLHQWSAGMREQKLMPDVRTLLGPEGFYAAAPARAYVAAGSFLRWLADTHGTEKLRQLYARADFDRVYGQPLEALVTEWELFLDSVPVDATAQSQAFARFRQGPVFTRACAHEVAALEAEADQELAADADRALALYRRCRTLQPQEPTFALGEAAALTRVDRKVEALQVLRALLPTVEGRPSLEGDVRMALADLAMQRGEPQEAQVQLAALLRLPVSAAVERTARVKQAALATPLAGRALWAYFQPGDDEVKLLLLKEALDVAHRDPYLSYLLGRRLTQGGAPRLAPSYLDAALAGELPDSLRREAQRMRLEASYLSGDCGSVRSLAGQLPDYGEPFRRRADEWVARCDFEDKTFSGPLVPPGPFR